MATLHNEYRNKKNGFNFEIKLTDSRKSELNKNKKALRERIRKWFKENKPEELQPKFHSQGSIQMGTTINPIPKYLDDKKQLNYDLDDGVYFIEKDNQDNKKSIETWHNWVYDAVKDHTGKGAQKKDTCVRVLYEDGHHIDLPIYYKKDNKIEFAHKSKDWLESDPKAFYEWFNNNAAENQQLRRIVRYLKAWKNFREDKNSNLKLPSGFALTILATNNYYADDNDDKAFRKTVRNIKTKLDNKFECLRPTTPIGEDIFAGFSQSKKDNFLNALTSLLNDCDRAKDEDNYKKASEYLRNNQFGDRFPLGKNESENSKSNSINSVLQSSLIKPRPYYG